MAMNPFPPQAYTRETLVKAYQWLQTQSPQLKELASTPDLLISLYQKAQLQGRDALERPTLQNFKNELRSLAGMMGEFETHTENQTATFSMTTSTSTSSGAGAAHMHPQNMHPQMQQAAPPIVNVNVTPQAAAPVQAPPQVDLPPSANDYHHRPAPPAAQAPSSNASAKQAGGSGAATTYNRSFELNSESMAQLQTIKRELNLSSTDEALKLALTVGYGRLSELFPKKAPKRS